MIESIIVVGVITSGILWCCCAVSGKSDGDAEKSLESHIISE